MLKHLTPTTPAGLVIRKTPWGSGIDPPTHAVSDLGPCYEDRYERTGILLFINFLSVNLGPWRHSLTHNDTHKNMKLNIYIDVGQPDLNKKPTREQKELACHVREQLSYYSQ